MAETIGRVRFVGTDWLESQMLSPLCTSFSYSVSDGLSHFIPREEIVKYCFLGTDMVLMLSGSRVAIEDENGNVVAESVNYGDSLLIGDSLLSSLQNCPDKMKEGIAEDIIYKIMIGDIRI